MFHGFLRDLPQSFGSRIYPSHRDALSNHYGAVYIGIEMCPSLLDPGQADALSSHYGSFYIDKEICPSLLALRCTQYLAKRSLKSIWQHCFPVHGLSRDSSLSCFGCYGELDEEDTYCCLLCGLPLCSEQCQNAEHHKMGECHAMLATGGPNEAR